MNVEISPEVFNNALEEIYRDLEKTAKIPGFRVGKVPRKIIVSRYAKDAVEEAKSKLINDTYRSSITDHNLRPVHVPKIENISFDSNQSLRYTAEFEIEPDVELKSYDGIKIKVDKIKITDAEIDDELQHIRESQATLEIVENSRATIMGDYIIIDYKMIAEDGQTVIEEGSSKMMRLQENATFLKDVIDELVGMSTGETKMVSVVLPSDYAKSEYAGASVDVDIKLIDIKEKKLPEVNDDFAKSVGNFESVEVLKDELRKLLESHKKNIQRKEGKDQIIEYLLDKHSFDLPETVVNAEFQQEFTAELRKMKKAPEDKELDKIKEKIRSESKKKVALSYILAQIATKENIRVDKTDLEQAINYTARSWNVNATKLRDHLTETGGIYTMQEQILQDKVLDLLYDKARVIEK
jgi:trigger factor